MTGPPDRAALAPATNCPTARVRAGVGVGVVEQRQRAGAEQRRAEPLHGAGGDQHGHARRQAAEHRSGGEDHESGAQHPLGAEPVAEGAGREDQRGEHQRVGADHPLQPGDAAAERGADLLHRHVDHGHVELDHPNPRRSRSGSP